MARWNNLPGALIAGLFALVGFALYGHPGFGALIASIFLITWAADTLEKRAIRSRIPCDGCGMTLGDPEPIGNIRTHPLRPLFLQADPPDPRETGPRCAACGRLTWKRTQKRSE